MHFKSLNDKQKEAVRTTAGPLLIVAGAGSGKTRVLTHRIAYLIKEKKVSPHNILAVTFTNKAAGEMRERLKKLVGITSRNMWIGTFHALCGRILRRDIEILGYGKNFVIFDDDDQEKLIREVLRELELSERRFRPRAVMAAIGNAKNELIDEIEYGRKAYEFFEENVAAVYRKYQEKLIQQNALDFDDMLMLTVKLFEISPKTLEHYQNRFHYISVDEYQDTNRAQYVITNLLAAKCNSLCVVGDSDQSIYKFRGADFRNIINFEHDYPNAKVVKLEQNYRSTQNILEVANSVIKNNIARKPKDLWTENPEGCKTVSFEAEDEHHEAQYIVGQIRKLNDHHAFNDFVVLYRTNAQSRVLEEVFMQAGVPYRILSGVKFYSRKEIKDILAYLRVVFNPKDDLSLKRVLNNVVEGVGKISFVKLERESTKRQCSILELMPDIDKLDLTPKSRLALLDLNKRINRLRDDLEEETASIIIEKALIQSGYKRKLDNEGTEEAMTRIENIKELVSVAKEFEKTTDDPSLGGFLTLVSLISDADRDNLDKPSVTLMTLHAAKGLEFPIVFIVGMEEGIFPHYRSMHDPEDLEEERRLCYVGTTRAKHRLFLVYARARLLYGETWNNGPSRFIQEVPEELLEIHESLVDRRVVEDDGLDMGDHQTFNSHFKTGELVAHKKWGRGKVLDVEGEGLDSLLLVNFDSVGEKNLLLRYAPLSKVEN